MRVLTADIGGTKLAVGLFVDGELERVSIIPTERHMGGPVVLRRLLDALSALDERPDAVGLSTIGIPRLGHDTVSSANIPGWKSLRVLETVEERFACPVHALNDVKSAALGEAAVGAGRGAGHVLFVNLGTGIACAAVVDGKLFTGAHGAAGEVGFWMLDPEQPADAASETMPLEERLGGRGLEAAWSARAGRKVRAVDVARSDEPVWREEWERAVALLAMHVTNMALAFDPEVVVVGGGMGQDDRVVSAIRSSVARGCLVPPRVLRGSLGERAGIWGAYVWATRAGNGEKAGRDRPLG